MLGRVTGKLTDVLCKSGLIDQKDREIYLFGIETALLKVLHYSTMLAIGLCFGMALQTAIFLLAYTVLRDYAGGYHAGSKMRCYLISWLMILSVLLAVKLCPAQIMFWFSVLVWAPSFLLIFFFVPVENVNKPLDETERKRYGKMARIILSVEEILSALFLLIYVQVSFVLSLSSLSVLIMLILGKIKLRKESIA